MELLRVKSGYETQPFAGKRALLIGGTNGYAAENLARALQEAGAILF
jgi:hypothetical protein